MTRDVEVDRGKTKEKEQEEEEEEEAVVVVVEGGVWIALAAGVCRLTWTGQGGGWWGGW